MSDQEATFTTVSALRPDTNGHNLVVKVIEIKPAVERVAAGSGKPQKLAECTVADETGSIIFSARNEQIDQLKPGSYWTMKNARIDMHKANMRLIVNQLGKLEEAKEATFQPKLDNNLSLVEYELVPIPGVGKATGKASEDESS